jgi:hypothetical protein
MQKLKLKGIYVLCRKCSSSHKEHKKIDFTIYGFFCDLIWNLQDPAKTLKRGRFHFQPGPRKD